jgi:hypothetical protein
LLSKQIPEETKDEQKAKNVKIQEFFDTFLDNQALVPRKDLVMFEFISKVSGYSAYSNRSARS